MRPILITAGATRNPLDAIRYLSAFSSGSTGVGLAGALRDHDVTLLGSAEACLRAGEGLRTEEFRSTRDLMARMERWIRAHPAGVVIHAAAVGDYEAIPDAARTGPAKIPSGSAELTITLRPTPKIIDHIRRWSPEVQLISFKAASPETSDDRLLEIAQAQRTRTGSALVFANVLGRLQEGVLLLGGDGPIWHATRAAALASLVDAVRRL